MAGGRFDKGVGKVLPGTYINFESTKQEVTGTGDRGTVVVPILKPVYGPAGEWIKLTSASPDAESAKLGYSIYDDDENRQMLLIREAFKNASAVYVYIASEGSKATATAEGLTATAKYGGSRGNALAVTVAADSLQGYNVMVHLDGSKVAEYDQLETIEELTEQNCPYIDFEGEGDLTEIAGMNLEGGTDEETTNNMVTAFLDSLEAIHFNTVCYPVDDESLKAAALTKVKYLRENMGRGVQFVVPDYNADYEGIISVTNSVKINDNALTHAEACAWVAGATAGANYKKSLTYVVYSGATGIVDAKTDEAAVAAVKAGEFFFIVSEAGNIVVQYDINSLITFADGKDSTYRKNRVIRVLDAFQEACQSNFEPNKFDNEATDWDVMDGIGRTILKLFDDDHAIKNVDYTEDFKVDRELSEGDETYFNVGLQPVDSAEKLYFTVKTR